MVTRGKFIHYGREPVYKIIFRDIYGYKILHFQFQTKNSQKNLQDLSMLLRN